MALLKVGLAELDGGEWLILGGYIICTCSLTAGGDGRLSLLLTCG